MVSGVLAELCGGKVIVHSLELGYDGGEHSVAVGEEVQVLGVLQVASLSMRAAEELLVGENTRGSHSREGAVVEAE